MAIARLGTNLLTEASKNHIKRIQDATGGHIFSLFRYRSQSILTSSFSPYFRELSPRFSGDHSPAPKFEKGPLNQLSNRNC